MNQDVHSAPHSDGIRLQLGRWLLDKSVKTLPFCPHAAILCTLSKYKPSLIESNKAREQ